MTSPLQHMHDVLSRRPCIVGVGNTLRGDDGVGIKIIDCIESATQSRGLTLIRAEDVVENFLNDIRESGSSEVLFIDAVTAELEPGSVVFDEFEALEVGGGMLSTHRLTMNISVNMLKNEGIKSYLLGVQALDTGFGEGLTDPVDRAAELLIGYINDILENISQGDRHEF